MRKLMSLIVALAIGVLAHAQRVQVDYYKNGHVKSTTFVEGTYTEVTAYYKSGKLKSISRFENGVPQGIWQTYDRHEILIAEGTYTNGRKTGEWLVYNYEDKKIYKVMYRNDEKVTVSEWALTRQ